MDKRYDYISLLQKYGGALNIVSDIVNYAERNAYLALVKKGLGLALFSDKNLIRAAMKESLASFEKDAPSEIPVHDLTDREATLRALILEQNRWEGALFVAESRKTQTPREIDLSNDLDSLDTKEKENPYEDLLHDCYVTTEMINTVVMKPVEKEDLYVEDLDLSKILRGYDEYGYCV